jgi:hypothetical protein
LINPAASALATSPDPKIPTFISSSPLCVRGL